MRGPDKHYIYEFSEEDIKYADKILELAGYTRHRTIYDWLPIDGWIYILPNRKRRFHAYVRKNAIWIHTDRLFPGNHIVVEWGDRLERQAQKFKKLLKKIKYEETKVVKPKTIEESINLKLSKKGKKSKRLFRDEVAPNYRELQKLSSLLNKNIEYAIQGTEEGNNVTS